MVQDMDSRRIFVNILIKQISIIKICYIKYIVLILLYKFFL